VRDLCAAAIDAATGTVSEWHPSANASVAALAASGPLLYAVGSFTAMSGLPQQGIARINNNQTVAVLPGARDSGLRLSAPSPNPTSRGATVLLDLPRPTAVTAMVRDIQGRAVQRLTTGTVFPAGRHSIHWDGRGSSGAETPAGVYFLQVDAGRQTMQRRIVIVR